MKYTAVLWCLVLVLPLIAKAEGKIGDESDGSQAVPVHLIPLFDEEIPELGKKSYIILQDDNVFQPFSIRQTCGKCHSYERISEGWHFNAADPNVAPGRTGQPWILVDADTATQVPLSYRSWPGTFRPQQLGITPSQFVRLFGRHMPGGGIGEMLDESDNPDEVLRAFVTGQLEINCLACHNAHPGQDQAEYAYQVARQNFRWATTAACEFGSVKGSAASQPDTYDFLTSDAIAVTYRKNAFDHKSRVLFDIIRKVSSERCYFCHSNIDLAPAGGQRWATDEDVHLTAGLTCVDCHRNGLDHNITRGYEGEDMASKNSLAAASSCEGCHTSGRLGAPVPSHPGIPPVHFDKLTCTACHSGRWPEEKTFFTKTSRAHHLGTLGSNKSPEALPHILYPVFARQLNSKIAPHKLLWPAFWGTIKEEKVTPINLEVVRKTAGRIFAKKKLPSSGNWPVLTLEDIREALKLLAKTVKGTPVYVSGGRLYYLRRNKLTAIFANPYGWPIAYNATKPYLWPIAHDVRPAAQSLGVRGCEDCHSTDAPFFFGEVVVDTPVVSEQNVVKKMVEFQDVDPVYMKAFALSFVFRPWLKVVALLSCAVLAVVLLLYGLKALNYLTKILAGED